MSINPFVLLTLTSLFWSGNMVLGRALYVLGLSHPIPPLTLALARWVLVWLFTLPFAMMILKKEWTTKNAIQNINTSVSWFLLPSIIELRHGFIPLFILAITGITAYNSFAYIALKTTTATNATLLNSFIPIMTMILGGVFLRRRISLLQGIGVVISMIGVINIVSAGQWGQLLSVKFVTGDLWMLLAVIDWAIYTLVVQWHPRVHPLLLLFAMTTLGLFALVPFSMSEIMTHPPIVWNSVNILSMLFVGIFPGFLGYVFYNRGIREVGANTGSLFIHLMPVFGALLSTLFLGESFHGYHLAGMICIFAGIGLTIAKRPI